MSRGVIRPLLAALACAAAAVVGATPAGARIPAASWGASHPFAASDPDAGWAQLALSERGDRGVAIWQGDVVGGRYSLSSAAAAIDGGRSTWIGGTPIADAGFGVSETALDLSADGRRAAVVWTETDGARYRVRAVTGAVSAAGVGWSSPATLADYPTDVVTHPAVAISADGSRALAAWQSDTAADAFVAVGAIDGTALVWTSGTSLPAAGACASRPAIGLSADGARAAAVWFDCVGAGLEGAGAAVSDDGVAWGSTSELSARPLTLNVDPLLALSDDGARAIAAWGYDVGVGDVKIGVTTAAIVGATATWRSPTMVGEDVRSHGLALAASADGSHATLLWTALVGAGVHEVRSRSAAIGPTGAVWGATTRVSGDADASQASLALSRDGSVAQAVWFEGAVHDQRARTRSAAIAGGAQAWGGVATLSDGGDAYGSAVGLSAGGTRATAVWSLWDGADMLMETASAGPGWRTLTVRRAGRGRVTSKPAGIDCGASCSFAFDEGAAVRLRAAPAPGWAFAGWRGGCAGRGRCVLSMSEARSATARFERGVHVISASAEGAGAEFAIVTRVRVPTAGRLHQVGVVAAGARSARVVCRAAERVAAGTAEIACPLGAYVRTLAAAGPVRVVVTTWFASSTGAVSSVRRRVVVGAGEPVAG